MNFLAHLHLSGENPGHLLGGVLGDFARGRLTPGRFPNAILQGIILHRSVDSYTDIHPIWRASKALLAPHRRRFAGIIVDVIYDHFLAKHWPLYADRTFDQWIAETYTALTLEIETLASRPSIPSDNLPEAKKVIAVMVEENWLHTYLDPQEIPRVLDRITHRSPALAGMKNSGDEFIRHYDAFESHFLQFYPDLLTFARSKLPN